MRNFKIQGWDIKVERPGALPEESAPCDFIAMTPAQAAALIEHRPSAWAQLGAVLLGGSPVDDSLIQQMPKGPKVFESFGMTETISHFALRQLVPIHEAAFQCLEGFEVVQTDDSVLEIVFPDGKHLSCESLTGRSMSELLPDSTISILTVRRNFQSGSAHRPSDRYTHSAGEENTKF